MNTSEESPQLTSALLDNDSKRTLEHTDSPRPPNYPPIDPKYPPQVARKRPGTGRARKNPGRNREEALLRTIKAPLKGPGRDSEEALAWSRSGVWL